MTNNDITTTAIALIHFLQKKGYKSYIISKVANLILLEKTQKGIIGTILIDANNDNLSNIFTQYYNRNGQMILHFGLYDFLIITTNDINKYRKHQPTIMDTLIYDGDTFIDYKNAKQFTLEGVISLNEELNPYVFNYIINQKALYNYEVDLDTISKMVLCREYFNNYTPALLLTKPFAIQTLIFLHQYQLYSYSKYKKQYEILYNNIKSLKILLQNEYSVVEIYYIILKTKEGLSTQEQFEFDWLKDNYNILDKTDKEFRLALVDAVFSNDILLEQGMPLLRQLITHLYNIRRTTKDLKIRKNEIIYNMCCRPYFPKQLHLTDRQIKMIYGTNDLEDKKRIITLIAAMDTYPNDLFQAIKDIEN